MKSDKGNIGKELEKIGCESGSLPIFAKKLEIIPVKITDLTPAFANIVKQEMLSSKGDAAVHARAITGKIERSDALLLGTFSMYGEFIRKIRRQNYPVMRELCHELESLIKNYRRVIGPLTVKNKKGIDFKRPVIMGILNTTDDSFYDGGKYKDQSAAYDQAMRMIEDGADIIDIGGESTRPGAQPVEVQTETDRVVPVIERIRSVSDIPISVDTYKSTVADAALSAGADIVNDISGMSFDPQMAGLVAKAECPVVIMHIRGTPRDMQKNPHYEDVIGDLIAYFDERIRFAVENGVNRDRIIIDPGIGFGKRLEDNVKIIRQLDSFRKYGLPVLIGASRKSMIGQLIGEQDADRRLFGTLGVHSVAVMNGAHILRVHDVKEHREMLNAITGIYA